MDRTFQVDLRGVVDLLSHHLYASPRVYLRELLQNAVDAITARRAVQPDAPATVHIEPPELTGDGTLRVSDTGIGLTEAQVQELLTTLGRTAKRDELGFARHEFLGQLGIGLLSCFLVADEVRVHTRCGDAPTVHWTGYSDGRYRIALAAPGEQRAEPGTTVTLVPRRDTEHWLAGPAVTELARRYGSLLPVTVRVGEVRTTTGALPWSPAVGPGGTAATAAASPAARRARLVEYARRSLGFTPFDMVDLVVPEAGLTGVAFVLPVPVSPAARGDHRVYLKRMLLAESTDGLLPPWAFFVRCVVDAGELRPTASREALYRDTLLDSTCQALGDQLRGWLARLAQRDPDRLAEFLSIHHHGIKALALHDDEMLRLVERWWLMETSSGWMSLAQFRVRHGLIRYAASLDEFRQLAVVAAAAGLAVVNAGHSHDTELIERLPGLDRSILIERLEPTDLTTRFHILDAGTERALRPFLATAQQALDRHGCEVVLRGYDPGSLPALYLVSRPAALRGEPHHPPREPYSPREPAGDREPADERWAGVLDAIAASGPAERPQLVLNHRNPLVRRVAALTDPALAVLCVQALYAQALLLGYQPIRPADAALLDSSFLGLLDRVAGSTEIA